MLAMARPCSTASMPCTPILNSSLSILKRPTCSLSPIFPKLNFLAERKIRITRNRIAAQVSNKMLKKLQSGDYIKVTADDVQQMKDAYMQRYEEIKKLAPEIVKETCLPKEGDLGYIKKNCHIVDVSGQQLVMIAITISELLRGAYVIVVNAENVAVSENMYKRYSDSPDGLKEETFDNSQRSTPERIIEHAVMRMLRKEKHGRRLLTNLKFYKGSNQPHEAQKAMPLLVMDGFIKVKIEE